MLRRKVILACNKCSNRNYSTHKRAENSEERLEMRKFCNDCGEHTLHRETK